MQGATKKPVAKSRAGITNEKDFKKLLQTVDAAEHLTPSIKIGLQLSAYVFLRSAELRQTTVDMIDLKKKIWVIPGEVMKMKLDHMIPLTDSVIELIERALEFKREDSNLLLPGTRRGRPVSENSFNVALRSMNYTGDVHVHHGYRTSFSTLGREVHRFESELIERQLAHVEKNSSRASYDRSFRLEERAVMLQKWSDYLDRLRKTRR